MSRNKHRLFLARVPPGVFGCEAISLPFVWRYYSTNLLKVRRLEQGRPELRRLAVESLAGQLALG